MSKSKQSWDDSNDGYLRNLEKDAQTYGRGIGEESLSISEDMTAAAVNAV